MKPVLNSCQVRGTGELSVPFSFFLKIQLLIKYAFVPIGCQACVGHRGFRGENDVAPALKGVQTGARETLNRSVAAKVKSAIADEA